VGRRQDGGPAFKLLVGPVFIQTQTEQDDLEVSDIEATAPSEGIRHWVEGGQQLGDTVGG